MLCFQMHLVLCAQTDVKLVFSFTCQADSLVKGTAAKEGPAKTAYQQVLAASLLTLTSVAIRLGESVST